MDPQSITEPPILVIMGVSGCGKTTVANLIADQLGWDEQEGDDLHPQANVDKMASGQPLTDEDRWPWLARVGDWIDLHRETGKPGVVTCSALKRIYRDRLRLSNVVFVHLNGAKDVIADRLGRRKGHYMPPSLLDSQLSTLEALQPDERGIVIDVGRPPEQEAQEIIERLDLTRWAATASSHS